MDNRRVELQQLDGPNADETNIMHKESRRPDSENQSSKDDILASKTIYPPMINRCIIVLSLMLATFLVMCFHPLKSDST